MLYNFLHLVNGYHHFAHISIRHPPASFLSILSPFWSYWPLHLLQKESLSILRIKLWWNIPAQESMSRKNATGEEIVHEIKLLMMDAGVRYLVKTRFQKPKPEWNCGEQPINRCVILLYMDFQTCMILHLWSHAMCAQRRLHASTD